MVLKELCIFLKDLKRNWIATRENDLKFASIFHVYTLTFPDVMQFGNVTIILEFVFMYVHQQEIPYGNVKQRENVRIKTLFNGNILN